MCCSRSWPFFTRPGWTPSWPRSSSRKSSWGVRLWDSTALARTAQVVERATELIHGLSGKPDTVAFVEGRTPNAATILVRVPTKGGPTATDVEKAIAVLPDAALRVGSVPPGGEVFP